MRVIAADMDLAVAMLKHGWCKPGQAEAIIKNPILLRKFRRMIKRAKRGRVQPRARANDQLIQRFQLAGALARMARRASCREGRTYDRLRRAHDVAEARYTMGMMRFVDRVQRRAPGRGLR